MKSNGLLRAVVITAVLAVLLSASAVPTMRVAAQSGRQPEKKKVEKKTEGQPKREEPRPPIPK
jgi:hypothetical protein